MRFVAALLILAKLLSGGCRSAPDVSEVAEVSRDGLSAGQYVETVKAECVPPDGWRAEPLKASGRHQHQVWLSTTGNTAYGVIHFDLPLPVGHDTVLWAFLNEMRRAEGTAELLEKQWDSNRKGLRFVAEGGLYKLRAILFVRGFQGWAIYAGTLRDREVIAAEVDLAERARDQTEVGTKPRNP